MLRPNNRRSILRPNDTRTIYYPLGGGLDVVTPAITVKPGRAIRMVNYEPWFNGGYRRVDGYERFDGRPSPGEQSFVGFALNTVDGLQIGSTVLTGDTSGASGLVVDFEGNEVALAKTNGAFVDGETLNGSIYTMQGQAAEGNASTDELFDRFTLAAADEFRSDIQEVPGEGPARGAWQRNADVFGVRDVVGQSAAAIFLSTPDGWSSSGITMVHYVYFDEGGGGTGETVPDVGDLVIGLTSGAIATVHRTHTFSGSTQNNDASGYLSLVGVSGIFSDGEALVVNGVSFALADGDSEPFQFPPGGKYQFINHNFFANTGRFNVYGCNGVGPAFEIDEDNVVSPILFPRELMSNQPAQNAPFMIEEHGQHLFLAFRGGSAQASVIGQPTLFNGFLGAAEFGVGGEITGMNSVVGSVLVITTTRETRGLFGRTIADWDMQLIGERTGGVAYSAQKMDTVYAIDDLGITSFTRTDAFGDFAGATVSQLVQPIVEAFRASLVSSTIVRTSNQYRAYFSDGTGLIMYVPAVGSANVERSDEQTHTGVQFGLLVYPDPVMCAYSTQNENSEETSYFVSTNGFVYRDRVGRNFDGAEIESFLQPAFNHVRSPSHRKRFRRLDLEVVADSAVRLLFSSEVTSGSIFVESGASSDIEIFGGTGTWDTANWDEFNWDLSSLIRARAELNGAGENVSYTIFNSSASARPFVIQGASLHYEIRRLQR